MRRVSNDYIIRIGSYLQKAPRIAVPRIFHKISLIESITASDTNARENDIDVVRKYVGIITTRVYKKKSNKIPDLLGKNIK